MPSNSRVRGRRVEEGPPIGAPERVSLMGRRDIVVVGRRGRADWARIAVGVSALVEMWSVRARPIGRRRSANRDPRSIREARVRCPRFCYTGRGGVAWNESKRRGLALTRRRRDPSLR